MDRIHLVECPRDALQGWPNELSTEEKFGYYKSLYKVGFDTLDMGSFVSPKAIPSMANTAEILKRLAEERIIQSSKTRTLVIVANIRGAEDASKFDVIDDMGFPLSLSETFQQRNTRTSISEGFKRLESIQKICANSNKRLVVYLSMGFGNPYGDNWHPDMLVEFSQKLTSDLGVEVIALSDTIGSADAETIKSAFVSSIKELPHIEFGAHLHLKLTDGLDKLDAALEGGCKRFDGALRGIGGCPLAQDTLIGNAPTERMVEMFLQKGIWEPRNKGAWSQAQSHATEIFIV